MPVNAKKPLGRPRSTELREDCRKICSLLSAGYSIDEIRAELHLTKRQYDYRMKLIRTRSHDKTMVWAKYVGKAETRLRMLELIRQKALNAQKPSLDIARRAIVDMERLDREMIKVGQELGVYERAPEKIEHTIKDPSLGMFWDAEITEGEVESETSGIDFQETTLH